MTTFEYLVPRRDRATALRQREAALRRLGRVRGWTIVGAGALTAAIAAAVSAAVPGRTIGAKSNRAVVTKVSTTHSVGLTMPPLATPSQLGLQGPPSAPTPAPQPQAAPQPQTTPQPAPAAVSGGS